MEKKFISLPKNIRNVAFVEHCKALVFPKREKYTTGEQTTWFLFPNFIISPATPGVG